MPKTNDDILREAISAAEDARSTVPGYPPAFLPVQVAQFILESDWGQKSIGPANNFFGIKARGNEPFVTRPTREFVGGEWVTVAGRFRAFTSMADCFTAHADLVCNRVIQKNGVKIYAKALQFPNDPVLFAHALTGVYATDPSYGDKLERIMRDNGLLEMARGEFDDVSDGSENPT